MSKEHISTISFWSGHVTNPEGAAYLEESFLLTRIPVSTAEGTHTCNHKGDLNTEDDGKSR